jgi:hypothetical protein
MSPSEVQSYGAVYYVLDRAFNQQIIANGSLSSACSVVLVDSDPTHLTPAQIDETIARMAASKLRFQSGYPISPPSVQSFRISRMDQHGKSLAITVTSAKSETFTMRQRLPVTGWTAVPDRFLYLLGK